MKMILLPCLLFLAISPIVVHAETLNRATTKQLDVESFMADEHSEQEKDKKSDMEPDPLSTPPSPTEPEQPLLSDPATDHPAVVTPPVTDPEMTISPPVIDSDMAVNPESLPAQPE